MKPEVLIPGEHASLGGPIRVGHDRFGKSVRGHLPLGTLLYRHGDELKQIAGEPGQRSIKLITVEKLRVLIDRNCELIRRYRDHQGRIQTQFRACSRDIASPLLAGLSSDKLVPVLESISNYPVFVRYLEGDLYPSPRGYDSESRHYFDAPGDMDVFAPKELDSENPMHRELAAKLISDQQGSPFRHFPWKNRASMVNALAAELTLVLRPALRCPVPVFPIGSPIPRTGKTLLTSGLVCLITGAEVSTRALPYDDEEMQKALLAALRAGRGILIFDNAKAGEMIDLPSLAEFITTREHGGRILGHTKDVSFPNRAVLFLTGNNLLLSRELSFRSVPIELAPLDDKPEERRGLPNLMAVLRKRRPAMLKFMQGMVQAWIRGGQPPGPHKTLPGFEEWVATVGGILEFWGLGDDLCPSGNHA